MTRDADALHTGDRIHITPHDVYTNHIGRDEWVTLSAEPIRVGEVVVIAGRTAAGAWTATPYCIHQRVELDGAA